MKNQRTNKRTYTLEIFVILIIAVIILFTFYEIQNNNKKENIIFIIKSGESIKTIAENLFNEGIIKNPGFFIMLSRTLKLDTKIKSGEYLLQNDMYEYNVLVKLSKGEVLLRKVIIPEGFTIKEIAERVEKILDINKKEFLEFSKNKYFLKKYNINGETVEGYLFPDTYYFTKGVDAYTVIEKMLNRFIDEFPDEIFIKNSFNFNKDKYIILASMIEKEAVLDREKPIIAGVYYNRLRKNMFLQCDATVLYALSENGRIINYEDCKINSPYNTYKYKGLPPAPICSPGKASIDAAINPEKNNYLFYVADGKGGHIFTKTYKEHLRVQKKLRY